MGTAAAPVMLLLAVLASGAERGEPARYGPNEVPFALRPAVAGAQEAIRAAACDAERRFGEGDPDALGADATERLPASPRHPR